MPRASAPTRELLYQAGLRRFAQDGWQTAKVRDIVTDAGQANDSAINYHFGSRTGLLVEILRRGVESMEHRRSADVEELRRSPEPPVPIVLDAVVRPLADLVLSAEGRSFVRVVGQVGPFARIGDTLDAGPVVGAALRAEITMLVASVSRIVGPDRARWRVRRMVLMLTGLVAVRAAELDSGEVAEEPDHAEYVADLVATLAAALVAEPSGDAA